jgi:hypothetical protein
MLGGRTYARFVAVVAVVVLAVDDVGFAGGAIEVFVAEATEGRVVVRALDAVAVVPPIDGRGRVGLVMLLFDAASEVRAFAPSVEDVEAVLVRLCNPLALALLAGVVVGRVGGLLRLLFVAAAGEVLLAVAEPADTLAVLVVVGFLIGGAEVREPGFVLSMALTREATEEVFAAFGDGFSVPEDKTSRSEGGSRSDAESTSVAAGSAGTASGSEISAMLRTIVYRRRDSKHN